MNRTEYLNLLMEERVVPAEHAASLADVATGTDWKRQSKAIDWLKTLPRKGQPAGNGPAATEPGVYVDGLGQIWKVQQNKAKTRVYALVWTDINGQRLTLDGDRVHGEWTFVPGAVWHLGPEQRMTLEQARQFTLVYGQCARCGRKLKAAESVEQGIGPVCRKVFQAAVPVAA